MSPASFWHGTSKPGMDCSCPIANEVWNYSGWSSVASCTSFCPVTGSDRAQRSADYLPDHGLQRVAQRLLRCLGVSSPDGACLKRVLSKPTLFQREL